MFSKSTVKYIQSLQHKKFRDEYNSFLAEGPKVVHELISSGNFQCSNIYATTDWIHANTDTLAAEYHKIITEVKDFELQRLSGLHTSNQVIAEFCKGISTEPVLTNNITIMLDDIRDPGNLGTIIRTADWFGIKHIICSDNTVDMYNPKVVQSTMASLGRVNIIYTDLAQTLKTNPGIRSYAAVMDGKAISGQLKIKEAIILIGNESNGVSNELLEIADERITIQRYGAAESLNAAVAAAILLYAFLE